jgi:hypothetical protein
LQYLLAGLERVGSPRQLRTRSKVNSVSRPRMPVTVPALHGNNYKVDRRAAAEHALPS